MPRGAVLDVGIPMLAVAWPILWIALVPVILIEGLLARRSLGLETKAALLLSTRANIISTLVGIPLTWLALLLVEMIVGTAFSALDLEGDTWLAVYFPFSAPWLGSTEDPRLVYLAFLILVIPFCVMSILVETRVGRRKLPDRDPAQVLAWARLSNLVTYLLVVLGSGVYFWYMTRGEV